MCLSAKEPGHRKKQHCNRFKRDFENGPQFQKTANVSSSHCHTKNQTKGNPEGKVKRAEPGKLTAPQDTEKGFSPKYRKRSQR